MNGSIKKLCLTCKYYRLKTVQNGICRIDKKSSPDYPEKINEDSCGRWLDCGQQYYIRIGWIKARKADKQNFS
jgi:hypothetical protein